MLKNVLSWFFSFIFGMGGGIFATEILWPYFVERPLLYKYQLERPTIYINQKKEIKIQENVALKDAISKVKDSIVLIKTRTKTGKNIEGVGYILTSDGLVITLFELVKDASKITVFFKEEVYTPTILNKDQQNNLALLKIDGKNFSTTGFFDFEKLKLGERVFLLGLYLENGKILPFVNEGIVRKFDENNIETDIKGSNEMLGTPLFDIEGNLLGINYLNKDGKIISIPISRIRHFANI